MLAISKAPMDASLKKMLASETRIEGVVQLMLILCARGAMFKFTPAPFKLGQMTALRQSSNQTHTALVFYQKEPP